MMATGPETTTGNIITPEQFSFTAEKKLMDSVKAKAVIDAEVLTFNRMAYRVIQEKRRVNAKQLSSSRKIYAYL